MTAMNTKKFRFAWKKQIIFSFPNTLTLVKETFLTLSDPQPDHMHEKVFFFLSWSLV